MAEPTPTPTPTSTPKLFIFPHAGGAPQYYVPFARAFTTDVKRTAVQYPGRGGNHDLGAFTGVSELAERVHAMLSPLDQSDGRVAFFGHSMGALVAFDVARRFEEQGNPIAVLFVSASAAPGHAGYDYIPESDSGLLGALAKTTGLNPDFLENDEFTAKILPTLRGFKAVTNYRCPPEAKLSCPIFAFYADDDEVATTEKVEPWAERTAAEFGKRMFSGHHFYLNDHLPDVVGDIETRIDAFCR